MPQMTLFAPDITCDHCIATIGRTVATVEGARFLGGDPDARTFAVDVAGGAVLDRLAEALAAEGYPLGDAPDAAQAPARAGMTMLAMASSAAPAGGGVDPDWRPTYRVTPTEAGADVNYACPCSCEAGFALDRSQAEQAPESCCCGRTMLVGRDAEARLRSAVGVEGYAYDIQTVAMPWGQPVPVALAIPSDAAHGAHIGDA